MSILFVILLLPLVFFVGIIFCPKDMKVLKTTHIIFSFILSAMLLYAIYKVYVGGDIYAFNNLLFLDALGCAFLVLVALTGICVNIYSTTYMKWQVDSKSLDISQVRLSYALSYIASFAMILSCVSNNLAIMWAAIEATTLATVFMVAIKSDKKSIESGYKYIVVCSVGLAFAMFATILLYSYSFNVLGDDSNSLLFSYLMANADALNSDVLKLIFIFALIGFGTKAGLVPTHTWLPDAHAQGPAPTSAMLSGIVLKIAMLGLIRYYAITANAIGFSFVESIMLISGTITLFVSAYFLIAQHDVKRMFAYHSVAHMGVVAFALGVGGKLGIFAAIFHCLAHSFTKALAFLSTGNTHRIYGTNDMHKMGGMIHIAPLTTVLFGISICSLVGVPAFVIFVSEFLTFKAMILSNQYFAIFLFAVALSIIFVADFSHFFLASFRKPHGEVVYKSEMKLSENIPLIVLAFFVVSFGVWQYEIYWNLVDSAVMMITKSI